MHSNSHFWINIISSCICNKSIIIFCFISSFRSRLQCRTNIYYSFGLSRISSSRCLCQSNRNSSRWLPRKSLCNDKINGQNTITIPPKIKRQLKDHPTHTMTMTIISRSTPSPWMTTGMTTGMSMGMSTTQRTHPIRSSSRVTGTPWTNDASHLDLSSPMWSHYPKIKENHGHWGSVTKIFWPTSKNNSRLKVMAPNRYQWRTRRRSPARIEWLWSSRLTPQSCLWTSSVIDPFSAHSTRSAVASSRRGSGSEWRSKSKRGSSTSCLRVTPISLTN